MSEHVLVVGQTIFASYLSFLLRLNVVLDLFDLATLDSNNFLALAFLDLE